jgi:hypothetical protein
MNTPKGMVILQVVAKHTRAQSQILVHIPCKKRIKLTNNRSHSPECFMSCSSQWVSITLVTEFTLEAVRLNGNTLGRYPLNVRLSTFYIRNAKNLQPSETIYAGPFSSQHDVRTQVSQFTYILSSISRTGSAVCTSQFNRVTMHCLPVKFTFVSVWGKIQKRNVRLKLKLGESV